MIFRKKEGDSYGSKFHCGMEKKRNENRGIRKKGRKGEEQGDSHSLTNLYLVGSHELMASPQPLGLLMAVSSQTTSEH